MKTDIEYLTAAKEEVAKKEGLEDWRGACRTRTSFEITILLKESAILALQKQREDLKSELKAKIEQYWTFDNNQQHTHTWHSKQDFLEILNSL